jgi:glycosyltransferase involved in cell wall biosynthesis
MNPYISIIIPTRRINKYLNHNIAECLKSTFLDFEIIVLTDNQEIQSFSKTRFKNTGSVGPAQKRDIGAKYAQGEILTFIDDDAYPSNNWLKIIASDFQKNTDIAAIGGPGITPPGVPWQEEASGWASASPVGAGNFTYRFLPAKKQYMDDYPSMNLSVRKIDFLKVGGFDSNYYPGEDTKLCLDLTDRLGKKILYEPNAIIYHHRRPIFVAHLKQNGNFGLHRGHFARILPKTSARLIYFLPSGLFILIIFMILIGFYTFLVSNINSTILLYYNILSTLILCYTGILIINAIWIMQKSNKIIQGLLSIPVIFITHLWYGIRFIQGFIFTRKLDR